MADIPPILLSLIVCERTILDVHKRAPSIIGLINTITARKYPARHSRMTLFLNLQMVTEK